MARRFSAGLSLVFVFGALLATGAQNCAAQNGVASVLGHVRTLSYEVKLVVLRRRQFVDQERHRDTGRLRRPARGSRGPPLRLRRLAQGLSPDRVGAGALLGGRCRGDRATEHSEGSRLRIRLYLVFRNELKRVSPTAASFHFTMIDGDGSCRSVEGGWDLESLESGGPQASSSPIAATCSYRPRYPDAAPDYATIRKERLRTHGVGARKGLRGTQRPGTPERF